MLQTIVNGFQNIYGDPGITQAQVNAEAAIEEAEEDISPVDAKILQAGNYKIIEADTTIDNGDTNGHTGYCDFLGLRKSDIQIAGQNTPQGMRSEQDLEDTVFHEFGHAMDDMLGNYANDPASKWSNSVQAQTDMNGDLNATGLDASRRASYVGVNGGYPDLVADLFEAQNLVNQGKGGDTIQNVNVSAQQMIADFHNTATALNAALQRAESDMMAGTFKGQRDCIQFHNTTVGPFIVSSEQAQPDETPLILELSNDAIHTTSANNGIYFDMQNTGFEYQTAWVGANDGMLVLDSANDGVIQNGAQLFGSSTPLANGQLAATGFAALAQYDTDNSGQINANDSVWSELKVWMGNGSLVTLGSLGITGINLSYNAANVVDANGNNDAWNGSFVYGNGTTGTVADYILQGNTQNAIPTNTVQPSNAILALPEVAGSGTLYDLQEAMQFDNTGTLQGLVQNFVSTSNQSTQNSLLTQIITNWTGSNSVASNAYGPDINGQVYAALQKMYGQNLEFASAGGVGTQVNPTAFQSGLLQSIYLKQSENIYAQLEFSGSINDLATLMVNSATYNGNGGGFTYDLSSVANSLIQQDSTDHNDAQARLTEFLRSLNGYDIVSETNFQTFENDITTASSDLNSVFASNNSLVNPNFSASGSTANYINDVSAKNITVTGNNDSVYVPLGDVILNASGINTFVLGNLGNDTITLGAGTTENIVQWNTGPAYTVAVNSATFAPGYVPGNDTVNLGTGINYVQSGFGNMIYNVSAGENDSLMNGSFNDTYNLASGFGNVFVYSGNQPLNSAVETFNFGTGLAQNAMVASGSGLGFGDLTLSFGTNTLELNEVLSGTGLPNNEIFTFAGGNSYTLNQLLPNGVNDAITASNNNSLFFANATLAINFALAGSNDTLNLPTRGSDTVTLTGSNDVVSGVLGNDVVTDNGSKNIFNVTTTGQGVIKIGTNDTINGAPSEIKLGGTSLQNDVTFAINSGNSYGLTATLPGANTLNLNSILATTGGGNTILQFSDNSTVSLAQFLQSKSFNVAITASNGTITRTTSFANENITNSGSNDSIYLGAGNDTVTDTGHANVIGAGSGTSTINLAANDTLIYSSGHSNIHVNTGSGTTSLQYSDAPVANDNIYFGTGITASSLVLSANGNNAILKIDSAGDQLAITDGFNDHIASLYFSNGSSETYASLLAAGVTVSNTLNNSTVNYTNTIANENITNHGTNDIISLGSGKDTYIETSTKNNIYGGSGNDTYTLNSTASNDTLNLGSGTNNATDSGHNNTIYTVASSGQVHAGTNDSIIAGSGNASISLGLNDTVYAGSGNASISLGLNDTAYAGSGVGAFTFSKNDGTAVITEGAAPGVAGTTDSLTFGTGITSTELTAVVNGNELSLAIADGATSDNINIYQELNQGTNKDINSFNFSNGTSLTLAQVLALPVVNNQSNASIYYNGSNQNQNYLNNGSNDILALSNGNDTYTDNGSTNQIYTGTGTTNTVTLNSVSKNDIVQLSSGQSTVTINANSTNDSIYLGSGNATVNDSGHNNVVVASTGNSIMSAAANDNIYGGAGNANITLKQNDSISTGGGVTKMSYAANDAYDIIFEGVTPTTAGTTDVLSFGTGITAANLEYHEYGNDLQLTLNDGHPNDVVYIASELNQGSNKVINSFQFSNNSTLTLSQLLGGAHPDAIRANPVLATSSSPTSAPADASSTSSNSTLAVVSPTADSSTLSANSSTPSDATPAGTSPSSPTTSPTILSPASTDSTPAVISSASSSPTLAVVSPASTDSTPAIGSSASGSPAPTTASPTPDSATPAVVSSASSSPTSAVVAPTPTEPIPAIVSSAPTEVSASPNIQTPITPVPSAVAETPTTALTAAADESTTPSTLPAVSAASVYENRKEATLGKHHLSAVKDAMSKFSDKSGGAHIQTNSSKGKNSVAAHLERWGTKDDKESATSKADKYALQSGKFLTGADYALTVQNLAAFAAEKSEYSGAAAKHNINHDFAQLAVGHH